MRLHEFFDALNTASGVVNKTLDAATDFFLKEEREKERLPNSMRSVASRLGCLLMEASNLCREAGIHHKYHYHDTLTDDEMEVLKQYLLKTKFKNFKQWDAEAEIKEEVEAEVKEENIAPPKPVWKVADDRLCCTNKLKAELPQTPGRLIPCGPCAACPAQ